MKKYRITVEIEAPDSWVAEEVADILETDCKELEEENDFADPYDGAELKCLGSWYEEII